MGQQSEAAVAASRYAARLPDLPEPASDAVRYSRLLRPFPTRRLVEGLYHVEADADALHRVLLRVQIEPPAVPDDWREALDHVEGLLLSLEGRCRDARPLLHLLADQADGDYERALTAFVAILKGLGDRPLAAVDGEAPAAAAA